MRDTLDRMINESSELREKIDKLEAFINSKTVGEFAKLEPEMQCAILSQRVHMIEYERALNKRIDLITEKIKASKL